MNSILSKVKGKFLLSINDTPEIRETFKDFSVLAVTVPYTVAKKNGTVGKELLIRNYEISGN